jgi:hypothetical protein
VSDDDPLEDESLEVDPLDDDPPEDESLDVDPLEDDSLEDDPLEDDPSEDESPLPDSLPPFDPLSFAAAPLCRSSPLSFAPSRRGLALLPWSVA